LIACAIFLGSAFTTVLIVYAIIHFVYNLQTSKKAANVFDKLAGTADLLTNSAKSIAYTEGVDWESDYIKRLFQNQNKVSTQIRELAVIIQAFDARLNFLVGGILNVFLLWDVRCSIRLDKWQNQSSTDIIYALDRIGHFEELISFATFSHNYPVYVFPSIGADYLFSATELGHPLIPEKNRVYNSFEFTPKPTVDIITGSNMAGKSTFLRTVGINMVLAYAGSVVCGERLSLSVFNLVSYMRIADSLNESTSTFKAELIRLKMILEHVQTKNNGFVLIDEMLRGTNSQDKYTGSKVFIEKLLSLNKPALFATHDLQLSNLAESNPKQVRNFNFDIQINDGTMHFDYKIKNGPCKTFNAAILLKEIGLSID
ncbi:MAG: DNA mismatch repair protein MutS, partial [Pedobacter sp.]|nr:DNA mismatch repair protein MutS [Pedobacter sp.]